MIPHFTKTGFSFRLVHQIGEKIAIYEQTHRETGRVMAHEVHVVQYAKTDRTFPTGQTIKKGTPYLPSSEQWGQQAWTLRTFKDAISKAEAVAAMLEQRRAA